MLIKALEPLTIRETGALVLPGEVIELEDSRAQIQIERGAAEKVNKTEAKSAGGVTTGHTAAELSDAGRK